MIAYNSRILIVMVAQPKEPDESRTNSAAAGTGAQHGGGSVAVLRGPHQMIHQNPAVVICL